MGRHNLNDEPTRRNPIQFTLRSLLVTTTLLAAYLSCLFAGPLWLAAFATLIAVAAVPVTTVTIVVYAKGYRRTFAIGALTFACLIIMTPYGILYVFLAIFEGEEDLVFRCYVLIALLVGVLTAAAFGVLSVIVRRMVEATVTSSEGGASDSPEDAPADPFG